MTAPVDILLVDDEPRNLDVLESILASPEYRLVRAQTAAEALLELLQGEFAVIVLDIRMPGMTGIELADLIKQRRRTQHVPIIFLTAYFQEEKYVLEGYHVGAVDYLTKPVNPAILRSKIGVFVDLFRKSRALVAINQRLEEEIAQRERAETALREANNELEQRVQQRTSDLTRANEELRASECALREGERRFRDVVQGLPAAVYTCDVHGRITLFNAAAVALWGREPKLGEDLWCGSWRLYRADGSPLALSEWPMAMTIREGRAVRGDEIIVERPDGTRSWVLPYPEAMRDASGAVVGAVNMLVDITEHKQAEQALRDSEERLRLATRTGKVGIWDWDVSTNHVSWSDSLYAIHGVNREQFRGTVESFAALIHPEDRARVANAIELSLRNEQRYELEFRAVRPDGALVWLFTNAIVLRTGERPVRMIGATLDITERKLAEESLRESEQRFRLLADNIAQFAWIADVSGAIFWYNRRWFDYTGTTLADVEGWGWQKVHHPDHVDRVVEKLRRSFAQGEEWEDTFPLRGRDGGYRWFLSRAQPIRDGEGRVLRWFGTNTDITEQREAEAALRESEARLAAASRAKDNFLAALSHELRTPLNPVLLLASEAAEDAKLAGEVRSQFALIRKSIELEARLIDDLLDMTRITRGKLLLDLRVQDAHAILRDALVTVRAELEQKRITLALDLGAGQPCVMADAVRLQQVFWNVLQNAVKFTPPGGSIAIRTRNSGDAAAARLSVCVADTGIGMTPAEIARTFDAFSQGDHADAGGSHQFGGVGLGLAISRMLVELHGGTISAASEGRGRGSAFEIELPNVAVEMARAISPPAPPCADISRFNAGSGNGNAGRILLVEDHEPTRTTLQQLLRSRRYEVVSAATAAEARKLAGQFKIDLVISDIGLPDGSGCEVMNEFRSRYGLRGIALTGYGTEQDVARSQAAGFVVHLTKPIRVQSLDEALAALTCATAAAVRA